jgi:mitofilin
LSGEVNKMTAENARFSENNQKLEQEVGKLNGEVNKMTEQNAIFADNNKRLEEQVGNMAAENNKFEENNKKARPRGAKADGRSQQNDRREREIR